MRAWSYRGGVAKNYLEPIDPVITPHSLFFVPRHCRFFAPYNSCRRRRRYLRRLVFLHGVIVVGVVVINFIVSNTVIVIAVIILVVSIIEIIIFGLNDIVTLFFNL